MRAAPEVDESAPRGEQAERRHRGARARVREAGAAGGDRERDHRPEVEHRVHQAGARSRHAKTNSTATCAHSAQTMTRWRRLPPAAAAWRRAGASRSCAAGRSSEARRLRGPMVLTPGWSARERRSLCGSANPRRVRPPDSSHCVRMRICARSRRAAAITARRGRRGGRGDRLAGAGAGRGRQRGDQGPARRHRRPPRHRPRRARAEPRRAACARRLTMARRWAADDLRAGGARRGPSAYKSRRPARGRGPAARLPRLRHGARAGRRAHRPRPARPRERPAAALGPADVSRPTPRTVHHALRPVADRPPGRAALRRRGRQPRRGCPRPLGCRDTAPGRPRRPARLRGAPPEPVTTPAPAPPR